MAKIKVGIYVGHGRQTNGVWDPGATYGNEKEAERMLPITQAFVKYAKLNGFEVITDVPKNNINMIEQVKKSNKEDVDVVVEYNSTSVFFSFDNYFVACRLVDGKYPNYEAAIPKDNPNKLVMNRTEFLTSLRRVSIFANQSTLQVRLLCTEKELIISAEDIENSNDAKEKIPCEYEGERMEIGFNAKFLTEMVSNIDTENVMMELAHPSRAGILFPINEEDDGKENILMLVMPVMLSAN